jgi:hypothetical protein
LERQAFTCFRCGFHPGVETLSILCRINHNQAADIWRSIRSATGASTLRAARDREAQRKITVSRYRRPSDVGPMRANHRRYLENRGFDPDLIERTWGVLGTGPASYLDDGAGKDVDYRSRLFVPVRWGGEEVSFQARDVTGRSELRYVSCPVAREVVHHKNVLYGIQERWGRTGIIVEGVTDCWRLGPLSCATFGISTKPEQVVEVARHFSRVAIVFDPEPQARARARRLAATLRLRLGTEPVVVDIGSGDPGSMSQADADHLVKELIR